MADKDGTERRVYVLPAELVERIKAYQTAQGIASEVEAARRLLDAALQMRDTVQDLLKKLKSRFIDERDLRVLASEVLASHQLVTEVKFGDRELEFRMRGGAQGRISTVGVVSLDLEGNDYWKEQHDPPPTRQTTYGSKNVSSWDAPKGGGADLDDEIPF